ncbi:MAG: RND transporter, partial [Burkholderiales bacterium]|nr:RND transporter [Burkholderiales bacterium]
MPGTVLACLLAGCMVGPDYERPRVEAPGAFRFEANAAPGLADRRWWEQFGDPVLNDLI